MSLRVHPASETLEGAGVTVRRLFPVPGRHHHDPFVLWDHFDVPPGTGFPEHPHRGFEAITYMLQGSMRHTDDLGNRSTVAAGGAQRFTAGRGIVHAEMPGDAGRNTGIQLWINLPRRLKQVEPAYQQVDRAAFPVARFGDGWRKTLVGEGSPLRLLTPVDYIEIGLPAQGRRVETVKDGFRGLVYLLEGELTVSGKSLRPGEACLFENEEALTLESGGGCHLLICSGQPHGEPIRQHGPFVD